MGVGMEHLQGLYADSVDPWGFENSSYEQAKFKATRRSLSRKSYRSAFELGCGNGQLALHLFDICQEYTGMDAVGKAVDAARNTVPSANFLTGFYPCPLPEDDFDLLIFSEILYFLDQQSIGRLSLEVASNWPEAEIICVSYLGPSGNQLEGNDSVAMFMTDLAATHDFEPTDQTERYRIDRGLPVGRR